jgi:ankyrin repeat protein
MEAPLIEAILQGDAHEVEELLNMNANVDEIVDDNNPNFEHDTTALMIAIHGRNADIVNLLIKNGADLDLQNSSGWTALMIATTTDQGGMVKYLVNKGANLNVRTVDGHAALFYACLNGNISMINYLGKRTSRLVVQGTLRILEQIDETPQEILYLLENILNKKVGGTRRVSGGSRVNKTKKKRNIKKV